MLESQPSENPLFSHTCSNNRAGRKEQNGLARVVDSGHDDPGFNQAKGGDPMSSEIRAGGSDFGYEVILSRQPSAR